MNEPRVRAALTLLQCAVGVVILVEAVLFVMPNAHHDFAQTHMPDFFRLVLGWGEIAGSILLLIPRTVVRGAWILMAVFVLAIVIHLLHGMYSVGSLFIYTAAAWAVAAGRQS